MQRGLVRKKEMGNWRKTKMMFPKKQTNTMALSRYDPFLGGSSLYDPFTLFLGAPLGGSLSRGVGQQLSMAFPRHLHMDVKETDNAFEILADVPGVEASRVNLLVDGDVVSIEVSEQREKKEEDPSTKCYRSERSSSFQSRSVRLPPSARMDELKADVEHGVLHVRVPKEKKKEQEKGPRRIKIGGGGGGGGGVVSAEEVKASSPAGEK